MPAPATSDAFVEMLHKSGLVEPAELSAYFEGLIANDSFPLDLMRLAAKLVRDGLLTNFQAQQLLKGRYRNFTIGKYRVLEPLGAGGMSKVFLVEHLSLRHRVAMKLLPIGTHDEGSLVHRFEREAKAVGALNHPNIVRAHDIEQGERYHYIIMDFVDGVNLHDLVHKRGPLDPIVAANYIAQAATGLQHVHETGLIHRDIKPGNLLVNREGVIKILDLGLARFQHDKTDLITQKFDSNAILGTADYLAPEQALKQADVDIRADIYGLGATFYFLLTGRAPFEEDRNVSQKLMSHQMRPPESLAKLRPEIPIGMIAVCEKMLAKAPEHRYQLPIEIRDALRPWTATPVPAPAEGDLPLRLPMMQSPSSFAGPKSHGKAPASTPLSRIIAPTSKVRPPSNISNSTARLSLTPVPRRSSPLPRAAFEEPAVSHRLVTLAAAAMLAVGILVAGLWWWHPWEATPGEPSASSVNEAPAPPPVVPQAKPAAPLPGPLYVDELGGPNRFTSISAAIAAAKDGGRILLRKSVQDSVVLTAQSPKDLTIEPDEGKTGIVWSQAEGKSIRPPLVIQGAHGLRVAGIRFDGDGKVDELIQIEGRCPGCVLERNDFVNCRQTGIRFTSATATGGSAEQPFRIASCRFVLGELSTCGIDLASTTANDSITIEDSRFEGPSHSGILIQGPASHLTIRSNRLFALNCGVCYNPISERPPLNVAIENNTFCQSAQAIGFVTLPQVSGSKISMLNNLFLEVPRLAMLKDLKLAPAETTAQWIWADEGPGADESAAPVGAPRYFRHSIELPSPPTGNVTLDIATDDAFTVWLNGTKVGTSSRPRFTGRVYSFDVAPLLRSGRNTIAIEAVNLADPIDPVRATPAAMFVQLTHRSGNRPNAVTISDAFWKTTRTASEGWQALEFDDTAWPAARPTLPKSNRPWLHVTWDAEIRAQLQARQLKPPEFIVAGNIRDESSWEGWPSLESARAFIDSADKPLLSRNPADANFLLYPRGHALQTAGANRKPCGAPPK